MWKGAALFLVLSITFRWTAAAYTINKTDLHIPTLEELKKVLQKGLEGNYKTVQVQVVQCPDLTKAPFRLAKPGLGGHPKLLQVGSFDYLLPVAQPDKNYDLKEIADQIGLKPTFMVGAGGVSYIYEGSSCEGIFNFYVNDGELTQKSELACEKNDGEVHIQKQMPTNQLKASWIGNLFVSEGKKGQVLEISAKTRTGNLDFPSSIRGALADEYPSKQIGLGGTFLIKEGVANISILKNYTKVPDSYVDSGEWQYYYEMQAPLTAVGSAININAGLSLTVEHFHVFSDDGDAGHYMNDITTDTIEYLGYFIVGEELLTVDTPPSKNGVDLTN